MMIQIMDLDHPNTAQTTAFSETMIVLWKSHSAAHQSMHWKSTFVLFSGDTGIRNSSLHTALICNFNYYKSQRSCCFSNSRQKCGGNGFQNECLHVMVGWGSVPMSHLTSQHFGRRLSVEPTRWHICSHLPFSHPVSAQISAKVMVLCLSMKPFKVTNQNEFSPQRRSSSLFASSSGCPSLWNLSKSVSVYVFVRTWSNWEV